MHISSSSTPGKRPRSATLLLIASLHGLGLWALCQPAPAKLPPPRPLWLLALAPPPVALAPASAAQQQPAQAKPRPVRTAPPIKRPTPPIALATTQHVPAPSAPPTTHASNTPDTSAELSGAQSAMAQIEHSASQAQLATARSAPPDTSESSPRFDAAYLNNPAPAYPPLLRRAGEQGKVVLRVFVGASGLAEQVELLRSSGQALFDQAALAAVRKWRFIAATRAGQAVAGWVQVPLEFRLH